LEKAYLFPNRVISISERKGGGALGRRSDAAGKFLWTTTNH
jgi:hypothetical protein